MGSPFKIPKRKPSESSSIDMTSPLSRLQDDVTTKSWNQQTFNGKRPHGSSCSNGRTDTRPGASGVRPFLNGTPNKAGGTSSPRPHPRTPAAEHAAQNRWRPKRASDSLCRHEGLEAPPATKKLWGPGSGQTLKSSDCQTEEDEGDEEEQAKSQVRETKPASDAVGKKTAKRDKQRPRPSSDAQNDEDEEEEGTCVRTPGDSDEFSALVRKAAPSGRRLRLRLSLKTYQRIKPRIRPSTEPIVLSSGDEDEEMGGQRDGRQEGTSARGDSREGRQDAGAAGSVSSTAPPVMELPFSTLHFANTKSRSDGPILITDVSISIPLKGLCGDERQAVTVVSSELHGYGLWDGALARDGSVLKQEEQQHLHRRREPSPSLLFLTVSNAQARLLQKELSSMHTAHTSAAPCPCALVVLSAHHDELSAATLASVLDVMGLRCGRPSLGVSLSWTDGLNALHRHPQGRHLLVLLQGHTQHSTGQESPAAMRSAVSTRLRSYSRQQQSVPKRLIQYPPPPSKGGITVTTADLECLRDGEFLNDVIIDFYLKYLQLERADQEIREKSHVFSSFFYKQLTRKDTSSEEEAGGTAQYRRHRRVRTWTRHVDIFSKDYLFIPVNQEAHWYLVVICFPGLQRTERLPWRCPSRNNSGEVSAGKGPTGVRTSRVGLAKNAKDAETLNSLFRVSQGGSDHSKGGPNDRTHNLPDCTALTCRRLEVTRRPCILIMDSLKLSSHQRVYALLRDYLQVEWEVRRGTARRFDEDAIHSSNCKVPLQDNSSDCGLYLLQYVESFLQNPVVHFELPLRLERWFPRQQVHRKRAELRELVLQLYQRQRGGASA